MIENTVITYLTTDTTLNTLLEVTVGNTKFYPIIPEEIPTPPYVTFSLSAGDETDEHIDEDRLQLTIRDDRDSKTNAEAIARRIKVLLDVKDNIQNNLYSTDSNFYIYYSKYSGGDTLFEPNRQEWTIVMFFNIKYQDKTASR